MSDAKLIIPREVLDIEEGTVVGQTEPVPLSGEDYLLQSVVSLFKEETEVDTGRKFYKIKRCGELKLTRIPKPNESW